MYKLFSAYRESLVRWKTRQLKIFCIVNQKKKKKKLIVEQQPCIFFFFKSGKHMTD